MRAECFKGFSGLSPSKKPDISEYQFNQKFKGKAEKMFMCHSRIVKSILILWSNPTKTDSLGPAVSVRLRGMSVKHGE